MGWKSSVRASTSLAIALIAGLVGAQAQEPVGEPIYTPPAYGERDGILLTETGFRVAHASTDPVRFSAPIRELKPKIIRTSLQVYQGRDFSNTPSALRWSPWLPGQELYFPLGFVLRFSQNLSPYLTWGEGTVNAGIPTAKSRWVMVSFQDAQAPILLVFSDPVQLILEGSSGDWRLRTTERFKGWVRVLPARGPQKLASTVGALGESVKQVRALAERLTAPAPELLSKEVREEQGALVAVWNFDRAGAAIPAPVSLAKAAGYNLRLLTGATPSLVDLYDGPVMFSTEPRLAVRFPMRRIPLGRALVSGQPREEMITSASAFDLPSVTELALASLTAHQDDLARDSAQAVAEEFTRSMQSSPSASAEPVAAAIPDLDILAAHALLQQARGNHKLKPDANPLWEQLRLRFGVSSWRLDFESDASQINRAEVLFSLTSALRPSSNDRTVGAMMHSALMAETILPTYRSRRGFTAPPPLEPSILTDFRAALFDDKPESLTAQPFLSSLMSPIRILTPVRVDVTIEPAGYLLTWEYKAGEKQALEILTAFPIEVEARTNLAKITPNSVLGMTALGIEPKEPGKCEVLVRFPKWAERLPSAASIPPLIRVTPDIAGN